MRKPRIIRRGATYHVVARANRQEFIFHRAIIKQLFLETVSDARGKYSFHITNMCIMSNHVHLVIRPEKAASLSRIMQWILGVFAMRYNRELGLKGHVWYDRFKSKVVESLRQFLATFLYVCDNPLRAGLVDEGQEYRYCGRRLMRDGPVGAIDSPSLTLQMLIPGHSRLLLETRVT